MDVLADLIGNSTAVTSIRERIRHLLRVGSSSRRPPPVLVQGETGTGKGLLARLLHQASTRAGGPFVDVNCAAIPDTMLEAELFGYERGAFTDARHAKPGLFQVANQGTLFLDEIALLPAALQAKLLAVLEDRRVRRLGATHAESVDVWVIAATNEDLSEAMRARRFREDLYHRLAVLTLVLPPLRSRGEDISLLAEHFLARTSEDYGLPLKTLSEDARQAIRTYAWPGNVRELSNKLERAVLLAESQILNSAHLELSRDSTSSGTSTIPSRAAAPACSSRDQMRQHLEEVLEQTGWNISRTASILGVSRNTVNARIVRFGLRGPRKAGSGLAPVPAAELPAPAVEEPTPMAHWETRRVTLLRVRMTQDIGDTVSTHSSRLAEIAADKVRNFGGQIAGQGPAALLAVFGLQAVEEPAVFAAQTALAVRIAARRAGGPSVALGLHTAEIPIRVGPSTPLIDIEAGHHAWGELDDAMQGLSDGVIVVTTSTVPLLKRRFLLSPFGPGAPLHRLDGLWHAMTADSRPHSVFVGRSAELALLQSRVHLAVRRSTHVADIVGEAGIGKSRLLAELARSSRVDGVRYLEGQCLPAETQTPFFPLLQVLRRACGLGDSDFGDVVQERVAASLREAELDPGELAQDLTHLLDPSTNAPAPASAVELKRRLFTAIQNLLFAHSARGPLVIAIEDLHWIDPSSQECLTGMIQSMVDAAILFVTTYRPGYAPPWAGGSRVLRLALPPLSAEDSLTVIRRLLEAGSSSPLLERSIQARAEGNPLFLEELSRAALERGGQSLVQRIPDTIEDTIAARLGALPPEPARLLMTAAVIGRDVASPLWRAIAGRDEQTLQTAIRQLERADFLYRADASALEPTYTFKHALVQEVTYGKLSASERRALHARVLDAMERLYPERMVEQVEQLAHHAVSADERPRAVRYLVQAGRKAASRSALIEALGHLDTALELLRTLPEEAARDRQELELQLVRAGALRATRGFAAPDVGHACERTIELCQRLDDPTQLLPALNGMYSFRLQRAEYAAAEDAASRLLELARRQRNETFEMIGLRAIGAVLFHTGRLGEAHATLERALAMYDPRTHAGMASLYGTDHAQVTSCFLGLALWLLGDSVEGLARLEWAVAHSERLGHAHSVALALSYSCILAVMGRYEEMAQRCGDRLLELAARNGLTLLGLSARFCLAAAQRPRTSARLDEMHAAAEGWWGTHAVAYRPFVEGALAEAHADLGDVADGLRLITTAQTHVEATNERWIEPELYRIHGRLLASTRPEEAETRWRRAIEVARAQDARLWELRASRDFAEALDQRGQRAAACKVLDTVLARFPATIDNSDVRAARLLRASLA